MWGRTSPPVSRILWGSSPIPGDHPSGVTVTGDLVRLTRDDSTGHRVPAQPCSGWGLPSRPGSPGRWWSLTPPFHPCLRPLLTRGHRRSVLCGTFRRVTPPGRYPAPCPVESGLSSSLGSPRSPRPPGELVHQYMLCPDIRICHRENNSWEGGVYRGGPRATVTGGRTTIRSSRPGGCPGRLPKEPGLWRRWLLPRRPATPGLPPLQGR